MPFQRRQSGDSESWNRLASAIPVSYRMLQSVSARGGGTQSSSRSDFGGGISLTINLWLQRRQPRKLEGEKMSAVAISSASRIPSLHSAENLLLLLSNGE